MGLFLTANMVAQTVVDVPDPTDLVDLFYKRESEPAINCGYLENLCCQDYFPELLTCSLFTRL